MDARTAYETFLRKRVSDTHWSSVKRTLADSGMEITPDTVVFFAKLRKEIPRANEDGLSIPEPSITEITPESHPDSWRTLQPPTEQPSMTPQQEPQQMPSAQPTAQPSNSTLATSGRSTLSQLSDGNLGLTQQQIQEAVEQQFGKENVETKQAILNYVAQDTFATATELQEALFKLRQMRLDILMKLIADHNQASRSDENLLKTALLQSSANRQQETEDFFGSFENQLMQMRARFGI